MWSWLAPKTRWSNEDRSMMLAEEDSNLESEALICTQTSSLADKQFKGNCCWIITIIHDRSISQINKATEMPGIEQNIKLKEINE